MISMTVFLLLLLLLFIILFDFEKMTLTVVPLNSGGDVTLGIEFGTVPFSRSCEPLWSSDSV